MDGAAVDAINSLNVLSKAGVHARPISHGDSTAAQRDCEKLKLKPEKPQRINNIKDLSRVVDAVLLLTCFGQAYGEDTDNAQMAIANLGNLSLRE
eukprot:11861348-Alexandrium_andersonii.AAC.1